MVSTDFWFLYSLIGLNKWGW